MSQRSHTDVNNTKKKNKRKSPDVKQITLPYWCEWKVVHAIFAR